MVFDYDSAFSKKNTWGVDFVLWEKSQNFAWLYKEDRIAVLVTDVKKF